MIDFSDFEKKVGLNFKNKSLLETAFTHRSYLNENSSRGREHNERLEFLGDAVLELAVTDHLFRLYPGKPEGELTSYRSALVNAITLAEVAIELDMNSYLLLSRGEAKDTGRARGYILANTYEAVVGAIYIDGGYEAAEEFVRKTLYKRVPEIVEKKLWRDPKSLVQEKAQEVFGITPSYSLISEAGPDHDKYFTVGIFFGREKIAEGKGKSKQEAEAESARRAIEIKQWV